MGSCFSAIRWAYLILFGVAFTVITLASSSDTVDLSRYPYILLHLAPIVVYGLCTCFFQLSPLLTTRIEINFKKSRKFLVRVGLFALLILFALIITTQLFRNDLKAVEKELAARGAKRKGRRIKIWIKIMMDTMSKKRAHGKNMMMDIG